MTTPTTNYGWGKPIDGGDFDNWGLELNTVIDQVDAQMFANAASASGGISAAAPTGAVMDFLMTSPPTGWVVLDGTTIGNAASGAGRANADTAALFAVLWNNFNNATLAILNSDGSAGSRGASAAADYAANKRMPMVDQRDRFRRSYKSGGKSAALGTAQADALQNITGDFGYVAPKTANGTDWFGNGAFAPDSTSQGSISGAGAAVQGMNFDASRVARTDTETRPVNIAYLTCIKL